MSWTRFVFALKHWSPGLEKPQLLKVGTGVHLRIRELAEAVAKATGFQGVIHWDESKSDGTLKRSLYVRRLPALVWRGRIILTEGIERTVALFREKLIAISVRPYPY